MRVFFTAAAVLVAVLPATSQVCNPRTFGGAYGFQLTGTTTISGDPKPVSSMGRLEFDGHGALSGTVSVNFDGYLLGNPTTGSYEVRTDCTITWSLQDTSGAFQHFTGKLTPDFERATFRQTDKGGARDGTLARVAKTCTTAAMQGNYQFTVSGTVKSMEVVGEMRKYAFEGLITMDAAGNLAVLRDGAAANGGSATVDSDCIVNIDFVPVEAEHIALRGVFVSDGKEILAIDAEPGAAVNARFRMK